MMRKSNRQRRLSPARNLRYESLEGRWLLSADVVLMDTTEADAFQDNVRSVVESAIEQVIMSDEVGDPVVLQSNTFEIESDEHDPIRVSNVVMEFEATPDPSDGLTDPQQEATPKLYFTLVLHSNNLAAFRAALDPPDEFFLGRGFEGLSSAFDVASNDVPSLSQSAIADSSQSEVDSTELTGSLLTASLHGDSAQDEFASAQDTTRSVEPGSDPVDHAATTSGQLAGRSGFEASVDGMIQVSLDASSLMPEGHRQSSSARTAEPDQAARSATGSIHVQEHDHSAPNAMDADSRPIPKGMLAVEYGESPIEATAAGETRTAHAGPMWLLQTFVSWAHEPAPADEGATDALGDAGGESPSESTLSLRDRWPQIILGCTVITVTYTWSVAKDRHAKQTTVSDAAT